MTGSAHDDDTTRDTTRGDGLVGANEGFDRAARAAQHEVARLLFGAAASPVASPAAIVVGGRYRLGERLGSGGQGAVWRAHDERLARDVAIKINHVDARVDSVAAQQWLRHEAKMLGRISHPNVVAVFDVGFESAASFGSSYGGSVLYAVLELVRGRTLTAWLAERPRGSDEIEAVFVGIAAGLQAAHDAGLVHCDVKPGNVFVTTEGVAKLGDFGLAHAQRVLWARAADVTQEMSTEVAAGDARTLGPLGGTPLYMPPEQFEHRVVDARADQYALAATWFVAVFGRPPHRGKQAFELEEAKLAGAPARPSTRLSRAQYAGLARALDPDPSRRHPDVAALARAVTRRGVVPKVAIAAALTLGAAGLVLSLAPRAVPGCRRADFEAERAARFDTTSSGNPSDYDVHLGERLTATWNDHLEAREAARREVCAAADPDPRALDCLATLTRLTASTVDPEGIRGRRAFEGALSVIENLPDPQTCRDGGDEGAALSTTPRDLEAELQRISGALARAQELEADGRPVEALAALDALEREGVAVSVYLDETDLSRAGIFVTLGRFAEAEAAYQAVWDRAVARHGPLDAVRAASGLAHVVGVELQRRAEGLVWVRHGRSQLERFGRAPLFESELLSVSASIHGGAGDLALAIDEQRQAIALVSAEGVVDARTVAMHEDLALFQMLAADLDGAEPALREVLRWREAELGPRHLDVARTLINLAYLEGRRGDDDTAARSLDRALAIHEDAGSPALLEVATIENNRAALALRQGRPEQALASMRRADEIRERLLPPDHPDLAAGVILRLDVLLATGDVAGADALASVSRDRLASVLDSGTDAAVSLEYTLARIDSLAGRPAQGLARLGPLIDAAESRPGSAPFLALWCVQAGALSGAVGDLQGAKRWADRAEGHLREDDEGVRMQLVALRGAIDAALAEPQ